MKGKDFLTLAELTPGDLASVLRLSERLKRGRVKGYGSRAILGKSVALVFEKPSTRTRVSFQVAISELGGSAVSLSSSELQLGRGETIEDTGHVLSRYVHCIMARVNRHSDLERLARSSSVPVINGLSEIHHPVQILADLLTLQEHKNRLRGLKVAWIGDGDNVCNSWTLGAALTGIEFVAATPRGYEPPGDVVGLASRIAKSTGGSIRVVNDPTTAVTGADCVLTDTFVSMGLEEEKRKRTEAFLPRYQVNQALMSRAKKDAVFQHCLPAHRGEEVTDEVMDGPQSVIFDEAENRLHTEKALLCFLMLSRGELTALKP
ncbi:MAG TPA: ornithine carbamoyltransferase [Nitrososphaerales archaeon]|nr:ornithine carbamoyltransferase [Nitrososphaerales archaeon]